MTIIYLYVFLLGLVFGSFSNMLLFRLTRHESILGRSYCDVTKKRLTWKDLIPIVSYIYYKGRCRECGKKLPIKYPIIEFINGLLFVAICWITVTLFNQIPFPELILLVVFLLVMFQFAYILILRSIE